MTLHLVEPNQSVGNLEIGNKAIFPVARKVIEDNSREDLNALSIISSSSLSHPRASKFSVAARVFPVKDKLFHSWDVCITIDKEFWDKYPESREALVFHELCHLFINDQGEVTLVNHDIEEFHAVLNKYGDWMGELGGKAMQLKLELAA
jgi:Putative phage metallopeptidase